jgi:hypothetical protein
VRVPGRPQVFDVVAHEQQLPIGQGTHLHPQVNTRGLRGTVGVEAQALLHKPEGMLNGMITNDKFCLTRRGALELSWWRRPLRLRNAAN